MSNIITIFMKIIRKLICQHDYRMNWDVVGNKSSGVTLNIGCGKNKNRGVFGLDKLIDVKPDIVSNVESGLPIKSNSVDFVYANHVLEHIENLEGVLSEIHRILRPKGCVRLFVPHFSNPYGHSDYTHKRLFGIFTFNYFVPLHLQKSWRQVPNYKPEFQFEVTYERLRFYSPLRLAWPFIFCLEYLMNSNQFAKVFYEYHFCYWFPIYGIQLEMRPVGKGRI